LQPNGYKWGGRIGMGPIDISVLGWLLGKEGCKWGKPRKTSCGSALIAGLLG